MQTSGNRPAARPASEAALKKDQTRKTDQKAQHARFAEAARELGCVDGEAAFKEKLAVIARQKPKDEQEAPENKNAAPRKGQRSGKTGDRSDH